MRREEVAKKKHTILDRRFHRQSVGERKVRGSIRKKSEDDEDMREIGEVQQGKYNPMGVMQGKVAYGGDGLSADGAEFYGEIPKYVNFTHLEGKG